MESPTTNSRNGPVPPHVEGPLGQLEGERPSVWIEVSIHGRDVDGIWLRLLAYLGLLREHLRSVIVDILEVDLQSACAACWRFAYVK